MDAHEPRDHGVAPGSSPSQGPAAWINLSQSSISSDATSPITPTFSVRAHGRLPSNGSSLASSPALRESLDGFWAKRPLAKVREEEPQLERGCGYHMLDAQMLRTDGADLQADYDWVDSPYLDCDIDFAPAKRARADEGSDLGSRIKTLSRKWTTKRDRRLSSQPESAHESLASRSRANSIRAPSVSDLRGDALAQPAPNHSFFVEESADAADGCELDGGEPGDEAEAEHASRTPLLPPVTTALLRRDEGPVQSPLQSPKVVSLSTSPRDSPAAPQHGLPSPPLSAKPSVSSFRHAHARAIVPSHEIPALLLAEPSDEWGIELGHANFTIHPEPHAPAAGADPEAALRRLEADWRAARANFDHHLASTREFYGGHSRTTQLTRAKWAGVDGEWRRLHGAAQAAAAARRARDSHRALLQARSHRAAEAARLPPLDPARCPAAKFPLVLPEAIVGPMERVARPEAPRPSRKRAFWRFLQGILPESVALGRA